MSKKWRIFRRLGSTRHDIIDFPLLPGWPRPNNKEESAMPDTGLPPQRLADMAQRALLERFAPASVLIERNGRVVWIHGATGIYLEPPPGEPSRALLAMASQTLRQSAPLKEFKLAFEGHPQSLARVHDILVRENWTGADLDLLVRRTMEPHGMQDRVRATGPSLSVAPKAGIAMAMVLNELATNAVKYGALSNEDGQLEITWQLESRPDDPWVQLRWLEAGGPPVTPPARRGFGSNLIARSIAHQLGGTATQDCRADGLHGEIAFSWRDLAPSRVRKGTCPMTSPAKLQGLRILVAEGEALILMEIEDMLHDLGCEIVGPVATVDAAPSSRSARTTWTARSST